MSYRIRRDEALGAAVRRIAAEQIDRAIAELDAPTLDAHATVHQVRKRCKKVRGLLRLVRDCFDHYRVENVTLRDAARRLSAVRDTTSILDAYDQLFKRIDDERLQAAFAPLRQHLAQQREILVTGHFDVSQRLQAFRVEMGQVRQRIDSWSLDDRGYAAVRGGLAQTYRRVRRAMRLAEAKPTVANLHEWRKRVKYHWYHTRLLQGAWPHAMKNRRRATLRLAATLGDDRDLTMLEQIINREADLLGEQAVRSDFADAIEARRAKLRARAYPLSERLFAEKPDQFAQRLGKYWRGWRKKRPAAVG